MARELAQLNINLSAWKDVESLRTFVYKSALAFGFRDALEVAALEP